MGIQVASLYSGGSIPIAAQQELIKEKPQASIGKETAREQAIASLPGNRQSATTLEKTTADIQHISLVFNSRLKFVIDHESNEILIKVIDNETDKVIKVLPPEELQRLHSRIRETIGFLFDRMV
jgi:flagellar protein FlaG